MIVASSTRSIKILQLIIAITINIIIAESFITTTTKKTLFTKELKYNEELLHNIQSSSYRRKHYNNEQLSFITHNNGIIGSTRLNQKLSNIDKSSSSSLLSSKSINDTSSDETINKSKNTLDTILSKLTSAFPLFVLSSAVLGYVCPNTLSWVGKSNGALISYMLSTVMIGMGMTLEKSDFDKVLFTQKSIVPIGVVCQFAIMPLLAYLLGKSLVLPIDASLYLGFILVGCVPGGTASNLVSLIAGADVALSVVLTSISTLLACIFTPLLVKIIVGSTVNVSGYKLFEATSKVVFLPVIIGMILNAKVPKLSKQISRFTPFASVLLVSLICGGVVGQNAHLLANTSFLLQTMISIITLHSSGFLFGYIIPRYIFRHPVKSCKTISIEVGMQNSALAVVLARSIGANPIACLPGALSATIHSCLGSLLAAFWRVRDNNKNNIEKEIE